MSTDLTHRDWLLFSQQKLIQLNAPEVTSIISYVADGGARLTLSNISEFDLVKLNFLTNTDQNNNYLYLEEVTVNLGDSVTGLLIPGLQDAMLDIFRLSDLISYLADSKIHNPFSTIAFNGISVGQFVDTLTAALPTVPDTLGIPKSFTLVLNPDISCSNGQMDNGNGTCVCPPGKAMQSSFRGSSMCQSCGGNTHYEPKYETVTKVINRKNVTITVLTGGQCVCNKDYKMVNNVCVLDCKGNTKVSFDRKSCICKAGYVRDNNGNCVCPDCPANSTRVSGSCDCKCLEFYNKDSNGNCNFDERAFFNFCQEDICEQLSNGNNNGVIESYGCNYAGQYDCS